VTERRLTWTAYLFMACEGYLIYAVGFITPYLESELGVPPWAAATPMSAMAVGFVVSALIAKPVIERIGARSAARSWAGLMAVAAGVLAIPISILSIAAGALLLGVTAAGMLVHVNSALGGRENGVLVVRANMWSVLGAVIGPLVLSAAARTVGWSLGLLAPVPLLLFLAVVLPASPARDIVLDGEHEPPLGSGYRLTWTYLVLCIGAEFSFVAWGAQVAVARASIAIADATTLASLYLLGMTLGRLALGGRLGRRVEVRRILRASTALAVVGVLSLSLIPSPAGSAVGFLLGGLGIAGIYPLGTTLALAHAVDAPVKASARLTAASGLAILLVPLLLGFAAGLAGVTTAWVLVLGLLVVALAVLALVPAAPARPISEGVPAVAVP
jgi:MFS family permease